MLDPFLGREGSTLRPGIERKCSIRVYPGEHAPRDARSPRYARGPSTLLGASVPEVPHAGEDHRHAGFIRSGDDF